MTGSTDGKESAEDNKRRLNDEIIQFIRKRSDPDAARFTARLEPHAKLQQKRRRVEAARRHAAQIHRDKSGGKHKIGDKEQQEKTLENDERQRSVHRSRSGQSVRSGEPTDACCRRRKRRRRRRSCRRRRRRRSRCGRRRRRRSRRRHRSCRRRRRSRSRRRRRRSCRRRRHRRRRCH